MLQTHFLSPIHQPQLPLETPIHSNWTVADLPIHYRQLLAQHGSGYFPKNKINTLEPTRFGLDYCLVNGLYGFVGNQQFGHLFESSLQPQKTGLPEYLIPFFVDDAIYFCFDYQHSSVEPTIRLIDREMDQWLTIAPSFSDFIKNQQLHVETIHMQDTQWITTHTLHQQTGQFYPQTFASLLEIQENRQLELLLLWLHEAAYQQESIRTLAKETFDFLNDFRHETIQTLPGYHACLDDYSH